MKKHTRIAGVVVLTLLYCLAINAITLPLVPAVSHMAETTAHTIYTPGLPTILSCHIAQAEVSGYQLNNLAAAGYKELALDHWVIVQIAGRLFETAFAQYNNFSATLLIRHRKSDIIFPFHYFW